MLHSDSQQEKNRIAESILQYPKISTGLFPADQVRPHEIDLGPDTVNSGNITVRDIDSAGRDEIAIPARITGGRGEDGVVVTRNSGKILIFSAA